MRSGAERVHAVMMPSRYTSQMSLEDAAEQARALGVQYSMLSDRAHVRGDARDARRTSSRAARRTPPRRTSSRAAACCCSWDLEQDRQMLLTTGNKSEMAVGYATLYGDMAGGFAPIKDCSKLLVYRLAAYRNSSRGRDSRSA